ncbi:MAG: NTP transferase domain-containing protein [Sedimentisphaerales bacterium]|nr:NTP transferase domain-containing protein [Sedimentisphaerales bacterium]
MTSSVSKAITDKTVVVILAAGKGTRMGDATTPKVCFEVAGIPAINRIIGTFKKQKFRRFVLVVGWGAEKVMDVVTRQHPEVMFVLQQPQQGTGHAARVAAEALEAMGHEGLVLVTMGDKFIEPIVLQLLTDGFIRKQADAALLTVPKTPRTEAAGGRVLVNAQGHAVRIVEKPDLARQALADELLGLPAKKKQLTPAQLTVLLEKHLPDPKKRRLAVPQLDALAQANEPIAKASLQKILQQDRFNLMLDGQRCTAQRIEKQSQGLNASLYLFTNEAFYQGVRLINNDNAQNEYYLTDIVHCLNEQKNHQGQNKYKFIPIAAEDDRLIQAFNSPDELLAIQDYIHTRKTAGTGLPTTTARPQLNHHQYTSVKAWLEKIKANGPALRRWMRRIYGDHPELHKRKRRDLTRVLNCYGKRFTYDENVVIIRAPGRVNLMGRHVDHRGGHNNFLAIDKETLMVAGLRDDDGVCAVNTQPARFKEQQFNIARLIGRFAWDDWINFVNSDWVRGMLRTTAGDWGNYIKAALLRLQHNYLDFKINGLNIALSGDIPMAAGLSSSSSIVVATLQAAIALNNLELEARQFVDLCGEGEWFVGSRGGAGDHAAIFMGQRGKIAHLSYFPFTVDAMIDAPHDYQVVIADSHIKAAKSSSAKNMFNARICSYNLGLELMKVRCPELRDRAEHLRDVAPEKLGCSISDIYRLLKKVPLRITRSELTDVFPRDRRDMLETNFASHADPGTYHPRGVLLFGIAEIQRSRICTTFLSQGDVKEFGRLMNISHDGDRVTTAGEARRSAIGMDACDDLYLDRLIADLHSEDPQKVLAAQLYMQPGGYGCSTRDIDQMVDLACSVEGVAGAQIAGAGLGGCIMALVRKESLDALKRTLNQHYYRPKNLKPAVIPCITVDGSALAEF